MVEQGVMTGKPLIESDRVEGTTVYDPQGNSIGSIKRAHDREAQRAGCLCCDVVRRLPRQHAVPWSKLTYDTSLGGYRTDITKDQLRGAPAFTRDRSWDWSDRQRERELHDYYRTGSYWDE
jgi:hypothetical protein